MEKRNGKGKDLGDGERWQEVGRDVGKNRKSGLSGGIKMRD